MEVRLTGTIKTFKVRPVKYFTLFGNKFAVHREVQYVPADDEYYSGELYVVSHHGTGLAVGTHHFYCCGESVNDAMNEAKKLLDKVGKEKVLAAINKYKIINS